MGLANVHVSLPDFELFHDHITGFKPRYKNMHLRSTRIFRGHRQLRFLHMMVASKDRIDGMASGPGGYFCKYEIVRNAHGIVQMNVLSEQGSIKDRDYFGDVFLREVRKRVRMEKQMPNDVYSNYSTGEFYLRRKLPGMPVSHENVRKALNQKVVHSSFAAALAGWNFQLHLGKKKNHPSPGRERSSTGRLYFRIRKVAR